jgi:hypothetical protein
MLSEVFERPVITSEKIDSSYRLRSDSAWITRKCELFWNYAIEISSYFLVIFACVSLGSFAEPSRFAYCSGSRREAPSVRSTDYRDAIASRITQGVLNGTFRYLGEYRQRDCTVAACTSRAQQYCSTCHEEKSRQAQKDRREGGAHACGYPHNKEEKKPFTGRPQAHR